MTVMILVSSWLAGLSLFDLRCRRVPVWLVLLGGVLTGAIWIGRCINAEGVSSEYWMGMLPGACLLLLALATQKAGRADGIVLMLLGSIMGFRQCLLMAMLSLILITVLSALLLILHRVNKETKIPYLPFLTMGFALCKMIGG